MFKSSFLRNLVIGLSLLAPLAAAKAQNSAVVNTQHPRDQIALQLGAAQMGYAVPFKLSPDKMAEACNALVMGRNALDAAVGKPAVKVTGAKNSPNVESLEYRDQLYSAVERVVTDPVAGSIKGSVILENGKKVAVSAKLSAPPSSWTIPVPFAFEARTTADVALEAEIAALTQSVASLTQSFATVTQNLATLTTRATALETSAGTAASTVASLSQDLTSLSTRAASLETGTGSAISTIASLSQNLTSLSTRAASLETSAGTTAKLASSFGRLKTTLLHAGAVLDYELTSVTTLAGGIASDDGTGSEGALDGTGADARFTNEVHSPVLDGSGNLYLIDGQTIRKVTPSGVVSTLAGSVESSSVDGIGTAAGFGSSMSNLTSDAAGNLYLEDDGKIRKVTPDGVVTTLAVGTEDAPIRFDAMFGSRLTLDSLGNLYAVGSDNSNNSKLLKIGASGEVTEFASPTYSGSGEPNESQDGPFAEATISAGGPMTADGNGNLYLVQYGVTDPENASGTYAAKIRKVTAAGTVTTLVSEGLSSWTFDGVSGGGVSDIAVDPAGNVFLHYFKTSSQYGRSSILKVAPDGHLTTLAGPGPSVTIDGNEAPLLPRDGAGRNAGLGSLGSEDTTMGSPFTGLKIDKVGNLYFTDSGLVRKATPEGVFSTLAGGGWGDEDGDGYQAAFERIVGIAVDNSGTVYVLEDGGGNESEAGYKASKIRKITVSP